jgi:hypothetical protein
VLNAPLISTFEAIIRRTAFKLCFKIQHAPLQKGKGAPRFFDNYQRLLKQGQSLKTGKVVDGKWEKGTKEETITIDPDSETYAEAAGDLTAYELMDIALGNEVHPSVPSWPQYYFKAGGS